MQEKLHGLKIVSLLCTPENIIFVVEAIQADEFTSIRKITSVHFYLVPGVGDTGL
jgi:hypothetical protein